MNIKVKPGKYVLAVSGGVDSMVLLGLLAKKAGIELIVAHFNHGIRKEAGTDEGFVEGKAKEQGLIYEVGYGKLGPKASEEAARKARYNFLENVRQSHKADAVITAHHQDDLIETALINLLRGTGRKGLVAIKSNIKIVRPLLGYSKSQILDYAKQKNIEWREDLSNDQDIYLRNYIRHYILKDIDKAKRDQLLNNIDKVAKIDINIDELIAKFSQIICKENIINRQNFAYLPISLGEELVTYWLRQKDIRQFDKKAVNRLSLALKTARPNTVHPVLGDHTLVVGKKTAHFA